MSILIKTLELSPLLLLLLMLMQCIQGESEFPKQPLLKLNEIVTDRIKSMLKQYEHLKNQPENGEFLQHYKRLEIASALPVHQLDEKITVYNAYLQQLNAINLANNSTSAQAPRNAQLASDILKDNKDLVSLLVTRGDGNRTRAESYTAFEKRVLKLLGKLGVYDRFTERVFKAIFSDEKQLKKLKKKLAELDDDDKNEDCCLWDFVFGLF